MNSLETRLHDELGGIADSYVASQRLLGRIESRLRARARARGRALSVGAVATMVVAAAVVGLAARTHSGASIVSVGSGPANQSPGSPAPTPPARFVAVVNNRPRQQGVLVDTATGETIRTLTPTLYVPPLWATSADGTKLYVPNGTNEIGCASDYVAVDTGSGATSPGTLADVANSDGIAPSPDGRSLAYTICQQSVQAPGTPLKNDVYVRRPDRSVTPIPVDGHAIRMSWSRDGRMLSFEVLHLDGSVSVSVLTLGNDMRLKTNRDLSAPRRGCALQAPRLAAGGLYATQRCPVSVSPRTAEITLVLLDPTTGALRRSWTLGTSLDTTVNDLAVDPTGGWALYSLDSAARLGQVWLLSLAPPSAAPMPIPVDASQVAWITPPTSVPPPATTTPLTTRPALPALTTTPGTVAPITIPPTTSRTAQTTTSPMARETVLTTVPVTRVTTQPPTTGSTVWLPSCSEGAPTTPYFINGCVGPDGSIVPPP